MKYCISITLITLLCLGATANEMSVPERMANKAVRGAIDMVTGIVELPMQIYKGYDNGLSVIKNKPASKTAGTILGFFRGVSHTAGRITHGGRELVCFWSADQASNKAIGVPFDAERSWEMGEQYSLFEPSLKEGVKPIGRKLVLGAVNAVTGIVEIPVQIINAKEEKKPIVPAAGKGVYYFISRTAYGFSDIMLCLVPNQESTYGYPYTTLFPWGGELPKMPKK